MSSDSEGALLLFDTTTTKRIGTAEIVGSDVFFPEGVRGWSDVLDCRHAPYTDNDVDTNCDFALHVHKKFILIHEDQLDAPPSTDD